MRLKTLQQAVNAMKAEDPDTALNRSMLLRLIADGILPYEMHGNRHIVDYDRLMLRDSRFGPHLRTVETAMREPRKKQPELGLGEDRIRNLIARGKIPSLRVGNRSYIPMEAFYPSNLERIREEIANQTGGRVCHPRYPQQSYADTLLEDILKRGAKTVKPKRA